MNLSVHTALQCSASASVWQGGLPAWRSSVTDHAWVYVVADAGRAGTALLTILVEDLEDQVAQLAERGLPVGPIDVVPGSARKVEISDPEGNRITFGQPLP